MKKRKIVLISFIVIIMLISNTKCESIIKNANIMQATANKVVQNKNIQNVKTYYASKLHKNITDIVKIKENTEYLQGLIDKASKEGGGIVKIPKGTYYFASAGEQRKDLSECVIKCRDNVTIEGEGTEERNATILKPYAKSNALPVDMFYYNNYSETNGKDTTFLKNADFKNFIIDGESAYSTQYTSAGKGFMINLFEDCDFENIIVKNTDATGFGIDCPMNSTIKNCTAINCGKGGYIHEANKNYEAPGASGFGIGTGYSDKESLYISNCRAEGNYKFGFFFEHQGRFTDKYKASDAEGFVVSNCIAKGNRYDFGGSRANDVTYENCISKLDDRNKLPINFEDMSRDTNMINCEIENKFKDVTNKSNFYYEPVYWAYNNGITNGTSATTFSPYENITRAQAVVLIWRSAGRPGDVVYRSGEKLNKEFENLYSDVKSTASYVDAVKWAKEEGVISAGTDTFLPNDSCTRAQFITMLWRYAGKPKVKKDNNFVDVVKDSYYEEAVNWAAKANILKGTTNITFSPNKKCTRAEAVTILHRYFLGENEFSIKYNLNGGTMQNNPLEYKAGEDIFTLKNPTKEGYKFLGWTGSNYSNYVESSKYIPQKTVNLTKKDAGNKVYTANWAPNNQLEKINTTERKIEKSLRAITITTPIKKYIFTM